MDLLRRRPPRLLADRTASVGLEMALVTPLIMLMLLGFYEAYMYVRTVGLVERAAVSVANTMARQTASLIDCADTNNSLNLGTYMLAATLVADPVNLARNGEVIVSAVNWPDNANVAAPQIVWQRRSVFAGPDLPSGVGVQAGAATLPANLAGAITRGNDTVLVAEVFYRFTPFAMTAPFWSGSPGTVTISRTAYFRARTANLGFLVPPGPPNCAAGLPQPTKPAG